VKAPDDKEYSVTLRPLSIGLCFVLVISISCLMHAVLSIGKCYDHRLGLESLCISSDIKIMPVADLVKEVSDCNLHSIFRVIGVGIKMLHQVTV
jgi:hypothetical protein